jgi:putative ABC transport system permease protein
MRTLMREFAYAARRLARVPVFTLVAVFTVAVGMGAVTSIYSVLDGVLLKPLPYRDLERLVRLHLGPAVNFNNRPNDIGAPTWCILDWREHCTTLESIAVRGTVRSFNFHPKDGAVERVLGARVTGNFFSTLGVDACLGRTMVAEESAKDAARVVLLSHGYWKRRFGSDSGVVGTTLLYDGVPRVVVGVLPDVPLPRVHVPGNAYEIPEIYVPLNEQDFLKQDAASLWKDDWAVYGRLKPQATLQQVRDQLVASARRLYEVESHPEFYDPDPGLPRGVIATATPLQKYSTMRFDRSLWFMFAIAVTVLLIACANVVNLFLARAIETGREASIRAALGAPPSSLIRLVFVESTLICLVGGALGALIAVAALPVLLAVLPDFIPRVEDVRVDVRVLGATFAFALAAGVVCGVAPSFRVLKPNLDTLLRQGGRSSSSGRAQNLFRSGLVAGEIAVALIVLTVSVFSMSKLLLLMSEDMGFRQDRLLTAKVELRDVKQESDIALFAERVSEAVGALPDVEAAALSQGLPLVDTGGITYRIQGVPGIPEDPALWPVGDFNCITPGYFEVLDIPLLRGRPFAREDTLASEPVVIVDDRFERRWFPGGSALGAMVEVKGALKANLFRIVGVVGHAHLWPGASRQEESETKPGAREYCGQLYVPLAFAPNRQLLLGVRTRTADPYSVLPSVRKPIADLYPAQPVYGVSDMRELHDRSLASQRGMAVPGAGFALTGVLLAAVGCYSVMAYRVAQRRHEIGIRMAIGATPRRIMLMVMRQTFALALVGCALGAVFEVGGGTLRLYLEQTPAREFAQKLLILLYWENRLERWLTLLGSALAVILVVSLSAFWTARKAARVDPALVLREE